MLNLWQRVKQLSLQGTPPYLLRTLAIARGAGLLFWHGHRHLLRFTMAGVRERLEGTHQRAELLVVDRLRAVTPGPVGSAMDFDDQAVSVAYSAVRSPARPVAG